MFSSHVLYDVTLYAATCNKIDCLSEWFVCFCDANDQPNNRLGTFADTSVSVPMWNCAFILMMRTLRVFFVDVLRTATTQITSVWNVYDWHWNLLQCFDTFCMRMLFQWKALLKIHFSFFAIQMGSDYNSLLFVRSKKQLLKNKNEMEWLALTFEYFCRIPNTFIYFAPALAHSLVVHTFWHSQYLFNFLIVSVCTRPKFFVRE